MAEAIAAISLAASILQLVEFGSKVVHRLHEFQSNINDVPEVFRDIMTRLPLLIDTLEQTQQADGAHRSERTANALKPVVDGCLSQLSLLDGILKTHIPKEGDSVYRKSLKALSSLAHDKDIQKINSALGGHVQTLTYYTSNQVLRTTFGQMKLGSDPLPQKPVFMIKFDHDDDFIGREDIMKEIDERYRNGQHRVAIAGIGGVG